MRKARPSATAGHGAFVSEPPKRIELLTFSFEVDRGWHDVDGRRSAQVRPDWHCLRPSASACARYRTRPGTHVWHRVPVSWISLLAASSPQTTCPRKRVRTASADDTLRRTPATPSTTTHRQRTSGTLARLVDQAPEVLLLQQEDERGPGPEHQRRAGSSTTTPAGLHGGQPTGNLVAPGRTSHRGTRGRHSGPTAASPRRPCNSARLEAPSSRCLQAPCRRQRTTPHTSDSAAHCNLRRPSESFTALVTAANANSERTHNTRRLTGQRCCNRCTGKSRVEVSLAVMPRRQHVGFHMQLTLRSARAVDQTRLPAPR